MKDFAYYKTNPIPYPNKSFFITYYLYLKGENLFTGDSDEWLKFQKEYPETCKTATVEKYFDKDACSLARKTYDEAANKLHDEFKTDLFEEFGVENNPKRDKAFALAWENGKSSGYREVYIHFEELVDLITPEEGI